MSVDEAWFKNKGLELRGDGSYGKPKKEKKVTKSETFSDGYRIIELKLMGIPMPKQSARFFAIVNKKTMKATVRSFQPEKYKVRVKDYQAQVRKQLPDDFVMFDQEVIIEEMVFMFPPLKGFKKAQKEAINNGELIPKLTRPDLPDNLKKLPLDAMSEIVYRDDSIIWKECLTSKVYGPEGCILIRMKGK